MLRLRADSHTRHPAHRRYRMRSARPVEVPAQDKSRKSEGRNQKQQLFQHSTMLFQTSSRPLTGSISAVESGKHATLEHFVSDGTRHAVEELRTHLRIRAEHCQHFLLDHFPFPRLRLALFLLQFLTRSVLIFLDDFVSQLV